MPISLVLILDLYFRLTPITMVAETPEVRSMASLLKVPLSVVVDVLDIFQHCDLICIVVMLSFIERQSALDAAFESLGRDDEDLPVYQGGYSSQEEREEIVYGQSESFYDQLKEQMDMTTLTDEEKGVMEYLIGSLDDDGLLRKPLHSICDELAIYHNMDMPEHLMNGATQVTGIRSCWHWRPFAARVLVAADCSSRAF